MLTFTARCVGLGQHAPERRQGQRPLLNGRLSGRVSSVQLANQGLNTLRTLAPARPEHKNTRVVVLDFIAEVDTRDRRFPFFFVRNFTVLIRAFATLPSG